MIILQDVSKHYEVGSTRVDALKNVNLHIKAGEIFGIIGYSGAGKSTLIRCINLLERPTSGKVYVRDKELTILTPTELRKSREKIGMIFQHFNLMQSRTIFQNVAYPLKGKGLNKAEIHAKVKSLLKLVGLEDKVFAYPSQLSGGQKQRVAIARALANDPQVLLCDEATSALDPQTTRSILKLLKEINEKLNLTIVIITHEMQVVKEICDRVAVMDNGDIVESGTLLQIFTEPQQEITREFVSTIFNQNLETLIQEQFIATLNEGEILAKITFIGQQTGQPFISKISRLFQIDINILSGSIEQIRETPFGNLIVQFKGTTINIQEAIKYLEDHSIHVEVIHHVRILTKLDA